MNYISKVTLKFLSILTIIFQVIFSLAGLAIIFASIMMLFVTGESKHELYTYILGPNHITKAVLLFSCLVALLIIVSLFLILHSLRQILNNIYQKKYFIESNLTNIKRTLIYSSIFIIGNILSMFTFSNLHNKNISNIFANSWGQILIYIVFLAIIYTIYLIFKYGVDLQKDSDNVI